jgi:hypothetical protein
VTSLPHQRRSSKGWWVLIAVVALLFFLLGRMIAIPTSPVPIGFTSISIGQDQKVSKAFSQDDKGIPFEKQLLNSQSLSQARQQIADGLHLSPDEITQQLNAGNSMQDIASGQSVGLDQLHNIELKAITNLTHSEMNAGNISEKDGNDLINRLQNNPESLDKLTLLLFTMPLPMK